MQKYTKIGKPQAIVINISRYLEKETGQSFVKSPDDLFFR